MNLAFSSRTNKKEVYTKNTVQCPDYTPLFTRMDSLIPLYRQKNWTLGLETVSVKHNASSVVKILWNYIHENDLHFN